MKKTYRQIGDNLEQVTVDYGDGRELKFLNGVLQMDKERFLVARGPLNGAIMLIIADYAHWIQNQSQIDFQEHGR